MHSTLLVSYRSITNLSWYFYSARLFVFASCSWRRNVHAIENETWFEIADLAPVIHNEAYLAHNEDYLRASKSGLLENDMIEPHPRKVDNILYQSDDESDSPMQAFSRVSARKDDHFYHVLDDTQPPQHRIPLGSHTYETIPTPDTTGELS